MFNVSFATHSRSLPILSFSKVNPAAVDCKKANHTIHFNLVYIKFKRIIALKQNKEILLMNHYLYINIL